MQRKINKFNEYPTAPFINDKAKIGDLVKWKLIKRNLKVTPKLKMRLIDLRKEGLSYLRIAKKINFYVSPETIRRQILGISKTYHFDNHERKILSRSELDIVRTCSE